MSQLTKSEFLTPPPFPEKSKPLKSHLVNLHPEMEFCDFVIVTRVNSHSVNSHDFISHRENITEFSLQKSKSQQCIVVSLMTTPSFLEGGPEPSSATSALGATGPLVLKPLNLESSIDP
jgi:hypothetical protein